VRHFNISSILNALTSLNPSRLFLSSASSPLSLLLFSSPLELLRSISPQNGSQLVSTTDHCFKAVLDRMDYSHVLGLLHLVFERMETHHSSSLDSPQSRLPTQVSSSSILLCRGDADPRGILSRYGTLIGGTACTVMVLATIKPSTCDNIHWIETLSLTFTVFITDVVLAIRIHAMYGRTKTALIA